MMEGPADETLQPAHELTSHSDPNTDPAALDQPASVAIRRNRRALSASRQVVVRLQSIEARGRNRARRFTAPLSARAEREVTRIRKRFHSPLHSEWLAAVMGITLGVSFTVCFLTGLIDYLAQHPPSWFHLPVRPIDLFRVTEGVHILTGIMTIPLLLAKLWVVYPNFFSYPPIRHIAHAFERLSLIPLVGGALFELFTGVVNIDYWYGPMPFNFTTAHFYVAWITIGGLIVHIGAKISLTRDVVSGRHGEKVAHRARVNAARTGAVSPVTHGRGLSNGLTRRGFLATVAGTAAVLFVTISGETIAPLRKLGLLAPRNPVIGPQSLPVNRTASGANVISDALSSDYRLVVEGRCKRPRTFTLDELRALPQREAGLPISCVEGWSAAAEWKGISLPDLLKLVGAKRSSQIKVESIEDQGRLYSNSIIDPQHAADPDTLLALELNGSPLDLDHGYPLRLIAPDRPGVLQTKWIRRVVVL
jgi:DMSO/TMAO reductase YedYZ molybdopterin-dependent catalytic subunit